MATGYIMPPGELLELYQLVRIYQGKYGDRTRQDLTDFLKEISQEYEQITGKPIETARNPRGAGRKAVYDDSKAKEVKAVYERSGSVRKTAELTGVSTTYVYKCIKE